MKMVDITCTYCNLVFQRSRKVYNCSKRKGGEDYKPFCNSLCRAKFQSEHSMAKEGLADNKKRCTKCLIVKCLDDFPKKSTWCRSCHSINNKKYREDNPLSPEEKNKKSEYAKEWRSSNLELRKKKSKDYYENNKDKLKITRANYYKNNKAKLRAKGKKYYKENREKLLAQQKEYQSLNKDKVKISKNKNEFKRVRNDPSFRLRRRVSASIRNHLKRFFNSKKNGSCLNYLSYSMDELRSHLEAQFEPWMSWKNYGSYNQETWDDNNQSTWTWQIDHIVPQYKLTFQSMEDENFKKCWTLENLRPLSSKQNLLDGVNKAR